MAYVLGFFCADGSLSTNKNGGRYFSIQIKDLKLLRDIKKLLQSDHKIAKRIHNQYKCIFYRLQIGSKEIWQDLHNLGIREQKTKRLKLPVIPDDFFFDFVRGYFDGDGGVWVGKIHKSRPVQSLTLQVYFTSGSPDFLRSLRKELLKYDIKGCLYDRPKGAEVLRYSAKSSILLCREMYKREAIHLSRKKKKFEEFLKLRS